MKNLALRGIRITNCSYGLFQANEGTGSLRGVIVERSLFERNTASDLEFNSPNGHMQDTERRESRPLPSKVSRDTMIPDNNATRIPRRGLSWSGAAYALVALLLSLQVAGGVMAEPAADAATDGSEVVATVGDHPISEETLGVLDENLLGLAESYRRVAREFPAILLVVHPSVSMEEFMKALAAKGIVLDDTPPRATQ